MNQTLTRTIDGGLRVTGKWLVFGLFATAPLHLSAAPDSLATIRQLVEQGQYERAYTQASAAEARYEGDPEFDFYYGLAALEMGYYPEAIFALERVVFSQPDQLRVRLELARAQFLAGNYAAARREFELVASRNPPPTVQTNIDRFLAAITTAENASRREIGGWVDLRGGADSNVNSATEDAQITTPIGVFTLVDDGRELDDEFWRAEAGVRWKEPLSAVSALDVSASWQQKNNLNEDAFDLGIGLIDAGWTRTLENGRVRVGMRLQNVTLDQDRFQNGYGLTATWDRALSDVWVMSLTGAVTALRYNDDHRRDTDQYLASASFFRPAGQFVHSISFYGATEPARDDDRGEHNGKDFFGALYGLTMQADNFQPYLRLGLQQANYQDDHPVFARERDDLTITASAGAQYALRDGLVITGEAAYTDVDSNLPVFEYQRFVVELGVRQDF